MIKKRETSVYRGKVEKLKKKAGGTYTIAYWEKDEEYDDAVDYDVAKKTRGRLPVWGFNLDMF